MGNSVPPASRFLFLNEGTKRSLSLGEKEQQKKILESKEWLAFLLFSLPADFFPLVSSLALRLVNRPVKEIFDHVRSKER